MYVFVILTIFYVAQAAGAASSDVAQAAGAVSSETAERLLTATGPDPADLWNGESGAAQDKIDQAGFRCNGNQYADGSGYLTECTGYYYNEGRCEFNSCCQGGRETGYGEYGWCGIGTESSPGGWAYCTAGCDSVPGFDEEDYTNTAERVYNINHRTISEDFRINHGKQRCEINDQGCATDGAFDIRGLNEYRCEFEIRRAGYLFLTEWDMDETLEIKIGRRTYNGAMYFHNLAAQAGEKIQIEVRGGCPMGCYGSGFSICLSNTRQGENILVPPPTMAPADFTVFLTRPDHACEITDDGCVSTEDYGSANYANDAYCQIETKFAGSVGYVSTFDVEDDPTCQYDYLLINGEKFCGSNGPTKVQVSDGDEIEWFSDSSVTRTGWKLCRDDNLAFDY